MKDIKFKYYVNIGYEIVSGVYSLAQIEQRLLTHYRSFATVRCQYTGLKDKKGKEIYFNSDVVSFKYVTNNGTIERFEGTFNYCEDELRVEIDLLPKYYGQGYICLWFDNQKMKDFQIIGNIRE